jgi:Na+-driven multidrug efflux pump
VAFLLGIFFNHRYNTEIRLKLANFKPHWGIIGRIYAVGIPSILMMGIGSIMTTSMNKILNGFSDIAASVFGVYFKLQSFIFMPVFGLNNGIVPIIGYNYGAGNRERMIKTIKIACAYAVAIMFVGIAVMEIFPAQLFSLFEASEHMLEIGVPALRIICLSFVFAGYCITIGSVFQALGNGMYSLITSAMRQLAVLLPVAYLMSLTGNINLVWLSFPIAELASVGFTTFFLVRIYNKIIRHVGK